jgi:hypothetical protein
VNVIKHICLGVLTLLVAVTAASAPAAAQQQQVSEARRAAIEECVQQAHQEVQGEGTSTVQQRYLVYVNCMNAAGLQP